MKQLRVLLLTSPAIFKPGTKVTSKPSSPLGNNELEDFIKLLSSANISYDIKYSYDFKFESIISTDKIHYSTIILALPEKELSIEAVQIIKKVSYDFGVSIVASCDRVGQRIKDIFGIDRIKGRKISSPYTIDINSQKFTDSSFEAKIKLGGGWKIPLQRWGLILSVKMKIKTYVQIHKMAVKYWDIIAQGLDLTPIKFHI